MDNKGFGGGLFDDDPMTGHIGYSIWRSSGDDDDDGYDGGDDNDDDG